MDWVLVAQSAHAGMAASAEQFYVSVSRGRHGITMYIDKRESIYDAIKRQSKRQSATELMHGSAPRPQERSHQHAVMLQRLKAYERTQGAFKQERAQQRYERRGYGNER